MNKGTTKRARCVWLLRPATQIGLILLAGLGLYLHTLNAPFIFDDFPCIVGNPAIRSFDYFFDFEQVRALNIYDDIKNNFALRPVAYLTFALNYKFGGLNVFGFHLVNICIHLVTAVLVYFLATVTLKRAPLHESGGEAIPLRALVPLLVALLFVTHPLQTSAVTYITQRFTSLATLFYLAALLLYIMARTAKTPVARWLAYGLSLLITIVAMKTKAIAFTVPVMMLLYDFFFLDGRWRQRFLWLAPFFLTLLIVPGTLFWLVATDGVDDPRGKVEQSINLVNFSGHNQWDYLKTQFGVIVIYLRLFFLPIGQNLTPDYPLAKSFFEAKIIGSFFLLLALFGGAIWLALRSFKVPQRSAERLIAFGLLWFFITISISSSIIPLEAMLLEYRVYLPSFGFFFAVVIAATVAVERRILSRRLFLGGAVVVIVLLGAATVARNDLYTDKIRLMEDILAKSPNRWATRLGLGYAYMEARRFDEAISEYTKILREIPNDVNMISNLGYALQAKGQINEAMEQFRRAVAIAPNSSHAHGGLGFGYLDMNLVAAAEQEFKTSLELDPHYGAVREALAHLYDKQGRIAEAIEQYRALLEFDPQNQAAALRLRQLTGQ
jgi:protein O-mannosyl-transferase